MLTNLHVKNLALIDEAEVEFGPGLNTDRRNRSRKIYPDRFDQRGAWKEDIPRDDPDGRDKRAGGTGL